MSGGRRRVEDITHERNFCGSERVWSELMAEVQVHDEDGVAIVEFDRGLSTLDEPATQKVKDVLLQGVSDTQPCVLVDLSHVTFFGSSFIEVLFRLWDRTQKRQGQFAICGLSPYCAEVLAITNLDTLWRIYPTRAEALRDLQSAN
jgi:anti-sigma B factor antagonist